MDGYQFEYQCATILKKKHFKKVEVTKSSGDQGVDIIAYKHRKKYGIQCKYYTHPVGNKAVQEAYAGANFYDCEKVIVMTNATFTKSAAELAEKLDVELWDNCPTNRFYSIPFRLMEVLNIVLLLYGILALFSSKYTVIHLPFTIDTVTLVFILSASVFGLLGWRFVLCNLVAAGAYLYLALHLVILPAVAVADCTSVLLLTFIPVGIYLIHAIWILQKNKSRFRS